MCGACSKKAEPTPDATPKTANAPAADEAPARPTAEAILSRAVEAVGGAAALNAIKSYSYDGRISIVGQAIGGEVKAWWKNGEFLMQTPIVGIGEIRAGLYEGVLWNEDPIHGLRRVSGDEEKQQRWNESLFLPSDWQKHFKTAEVTGEKTIHDENAYEVTLKDGDLALQLYFSEKTGLMVGQTFNTVTPQGNMPTRLTLEDYREVEGIQWAYKQVTDLGIGKAVQLLNNITFNAEVDETTFAMPTKGHDVVTPQTVSQLPKTAAAPDVKRAGGM